MRRKKRASHKATEKEYNRRNKRRAWKHFFRAIIELFNFGADIPKVDAHDDEPPLFI